MALAYELETGRVSPNRDIRESRKVSYIVIHHWGSRGQKFANVVAWLCNPRAKVSAHYVAEAGRVARLVPEKDVAWHAPGGNANGIGIECRPEATDADYATVAALVRDIRSRHGNIPLRPHKSFVSTACPGAWDLDRLDRLARGVKPAPATAKPEGAGQLTVDGRMSRDTVRALQRFLNSRVKSRTLTVDGRAGESTWRSLQEYLHAPHVDGKISRQSHTATSLGNGLVPRAWEHTGPHSRGSQTVRLLQKWVRVPIDGVWGEATTRGLQEKLNAHNAQ